MNVCQFYSHHLAPSGVQDVISNLTINLLKSGHNVYLIAKKNNLEQPLVIESDRLNNFRFRLPRSKGLFHQYITERFLYKILYNNKVDIIHAHMAYPSGYYAVNIAKNLRIPVVITTHGADIQIQPEFNYGARLDPKIDKKTKITLQKADGLIAISESMKEELSSLCGDGDKIITINNGVNIDDFQTKSEIIRGKPYIFAMGRFVPKKGFDILIKAFVHIIEKINNIDLLIAGDGVERKKLDSLIERKRLKNRVSLIGQINYIEKIKYFQNCKFFVCPSRREPFGIVNIEALAAGKPIVAFQIDGIPEIIIDKYNGLLAERINDRDLTKCILELLNNKILYKQLSVNAIKSSKKYDWKIISKKYLKYYQTVISKKYDF